MAAPRAGERAGGLGAVHAALLFAALSSVLAACYSTRSGYPLPPPREIVIRVVSGGARLSVQSNALEDVYLDAGLLELLFPERPPARREGAGGAGDPARRQERGFPDDRWTVKAELSLAAGEAFSYTLGPGELLLVNAGALGGGEAVLSVREHGAEYTRAVPAANPLGLTLFFSNR